MGLNILSFFFEKYHRNYKNIQLIFSYLYSSALCANNSPTIYSLKLFKEIQKAWLKWPMF